MVEIVGEFESVTRWPLRTLWKECDFGLGGCQASLDLTTRGAIHHRRWEGKSIHFIPIVTGPDHIVVAGGLVTASGTSRRSSARLRRTMPSIMDWNSRAVLSWRISNALDTRFCLEPLAEAVKVAGRAPDILNTDQVYQYTSIAWIGAVEELGTKVSMDGKGRWVDSVFIERLWCSLKCEDLFEGLPRSGGAGAGRFAVD